jgi:hypothetical protein
MLRVRGDGLSFFSVSSENFTGSDASTNTCRSCRMPCVAREKWVTPAAWLMTTRPLSATRTIGPGVGDHASPESSSRTNSASAVGSVTGSLANGVSRFSRLFPDHVWAEPDVVISVPNRGLAMIFVQGIGVSSSPSRTIAYDRPPSVKPPNPFAKVIGGTSTSVGSGSSRVFHTAHSARRVRT